MKFNQNQCKIAATATLFRSKHRLMNDLTVQSFGSVSIRPTLVATLNAYIPLTINFIEFANHFKLRLSKVRRRNCKKKIHRSMNTERGIRERDTHTVQKREKNVKK